jgi:hypothetical protein
MSDTVNVKKQVARNAWNEVFHKLGGVDRLMSWANDGNLSEFYKILAKLAPPLKEDKDTQATHDAFIKMIMAEEHKQLKEVNKPVMLLDVDAKISDNSTC